MMGRRKARKTGRGLGGAGHAVASKPRISHNQGGEAQQNHGVLEPADAVRMKARRRRHAVVPGQDGGTVVMVMDDAGTGTVV